MNYDYPWDSQTLLWYYRVTRAQVLYLTLHALTAWKQKANDNG